MTHKEIAHIGMFAAVTVVLGVLENFLPMPVPAVRLGLANIGVMLMLYMGGVKPAFMVMILKIVLVPLLSGNILFRLSLAAPAGMVAFLAMLMSVYLLRRASVLSTAALGAFGHMLTQLWIVDMFYIKGIFSGSIVGFFLLTAVVTGIFTGFITTLVYNRLSALKINY